MNSKKINDNHLYFPLCDPENPSKATLVPITKEQYRALYPNIRATQKCAVSQSVHIPSLLSSEMR